MNTTETTIENNNTGPHLVSQDTFSDSKNPHLVILGGGFGGTHTFKALPLWLKKQAQITVIDKKDHFLFTPLLPELAGSSLKPSDVSIPLQDIFDKHAKYHQGIVDSINVKDKTVTLENNETISYDYLVSSIGANTFFFGTPGAQEYAHVFKTRDDAEKLKQHCIDLFEQAAKIDDKDKQKELLSFMIIGGGPTGIELVTELSELIHSLLIPHHDNISQDLVSITVVNGGARILGMFDESLSQHAQESLSKEHIVLKNNVRITEIKESSAITADGEELFANTIIWTAGVSAIDLNCTCGTFKKERGRIHVQEDLSILDANETFIIGDMALFPTADGRGLPMTAQVARQQGIHTAKNIAALVRGKKTTAFVYKEKGMLASLGSYDAIGQVFGFKIKGLIAWILWRGVYLGLFSSWKKRFAIMHQWFKNLILGRKLHK